MPSLELVFIQILNGLVFGMLLLLLSLGLALILGIAGILNFAHGAIYAAGAYVTFALVSQTSSFLLGVAGAAVFVILLGGIIEIVSLRPIADRDVLYQLLTTLGVALILEGVIINVFGATAKRISLTAIPKPITGPITIGSITYSRYRLFIVAASAVLTLLVLLALRHTEHGVRIRATLFDREMVQALGTDTSKLMTGVFMFGAGLAAIAGGLAAPLLSVYPNMGVNILVTIFIVVLVGGLGSLKGTIVASLLIGQVQTLGSAFFPEFSGMYIYVILFIVLLSRPHGLFGTIEVGH